MYLKKLIILSILFSSFARNTPALCIVHEKPQDIESRAADCYNKGIDFGRAGILDSALFYGQRAVELYTSILPTDSTMLANAYQSLGIINKILGKYTDAIECYNKAEEIYINKNNELLLAYIYANKANIYYIQQDYSKSLDYHYRSYEVYIKDSVSNKNAIAISYNNTGNIYRIRKDYHAAIRYYNRSLQYRTNLKYITYNNLAKCYEKLENFNLADLQYNKAIGEAINTYGVNNIYTAGIYLSYAVFLSQQQNEIDAFNYFRMTTEIYQSNFGEKHPYLSDAYNELGEHYLRNEQLDSALHYFQKSLIAISPGFNNMKIDSNPEISEVLSKTHFLSALKNKALALQLKASESNNIELYQISLATFDLAKEVTTAIRSGYLNDESKLFLADNEYETFSNALHTSYTLYELTKQDIYLEKAFHYSESSKAAILNEAIKESQALNIGGIPDSLLNTEKQLEKSIWNYEELIYEEKRKKNPDENRLQYWNKYLFENKKQLDELTKYLENNYSKYYDFKYKQNTLTTSEIKKSLKKKDILIEYFISNEYIYTFLINQNKTVLLQKEKDSHFEEYLDTLLSSLSNNNFSYHGMSDFNQFQQSSAYLYEKLIKPIESELNGKNLIIIPDGRLAYLPFETLISKKDIYNKLNYKELPYLIKSNSISYSYSANYLLNENNKHSGVHNLAAFAPTYTNIELLDSTMLATRQEYRENLFPLKGIKEEAEQVAKYTNGDIYLDFDASEKKFKEVAANYDILHLAMHTIMNDENPMYSKMAFTQSEDPGEDGFLNTYELYNMKLNSRMAVLSSCNSGSGKLHRGEGVMSLARGFVYAGCPSLIMTLWSVEDKSGVSLMSNFYWYLKKGFSKSESLQKSKIDFIEQADQLKSHPYFWSGYVVIGNNEALFTPHKKYYYIAAILFLIIGIYLRFRKTN